MNPLLDPEARPVIAHRGNSAFLPENTVESLVEGIALGADGVEFDVHLTRDGEAVVIHDATVDRTTNGSGPVAGFTLAELRRLDAGYRFTRDGGRNFDWRDHEVRISSLDEVLDAIGTTPAIIEIKTPAVATEAKRVLERHGAVARVLVGSFSADALAPFRGTAFATAASRADTVRLLLASLGGGIDRLPYQALLIPPSSHGIPVPVLRLARAGRRGGVLTHVWTIDDAARARTYWDGGVNGILTNDPAAILAAAGRSHPSRSLAPA
jgi:glycerophosphoryl diester phosphodiesterase